MMKKSSISAQEFMLLNQNEHVTIIDVRTPIEVITEHIAGSVFLPLQRLTEATFTEITSSIIDIKQPIYILCQRGIRADAAVKKLEKIAGIHLIVIEGGLNQLKAHGQPLDKGSSDIITLERQVSIVAGVLILIGVLLGTAIHLYFYVLPALIGLNLLFSGITQLNILGVLLTKMRWNK